MSSKIPQIPSVQGIMTYQIGGVPLVAYLGIGITTVCLAAVTIYESNHPDESQNVNRSFLYDLPKEIAETIDNEPSKNGEIKGGKRKKKKKTLKKKK